MSEKRAFRRDFRREVENAVVAALVDDGPAYDFAEHLANAVETFVDSAIYAAMDVATEPVEVVREFDTASEPDETPTLHDVEPDDLDDGDAATDPRYPFGASGVEPPGNLPPTKLYRVGDVISMGVGQWFVCALVYDRIKYWMPCGEPGPGHDGRVTYIGGGLPHLAPPPKDDPPICPLCEEPSLADTVRSLRADLDVVAAQKKDVQVNADRVGEWLAETRRLRAEVADLLADTRRAKDEAQTAASDAGSYSVAAAGRVAAAKTHADTADTRAKDAGMFSASARGNAASAEKSAGRSGEHAARAERNADNTGAARASCVSLRDECQAAEKAAGGHAESASQSQRRAAGLVEDNAEAIVAAVKDAKGHADRSRESAERAGGNADSAEEHRNAAFGYAAEAQGHEHAAKGHADLAEQRSVSAGERANASAEYAGKASDSERRAGDAVDKARQAQNECSVFVDHARDYATGAAGHAKTAARNADRAEEAAKVATTQADRVTAKAASRPRPKRDARGRFVGSPTTAAYNLVKRGRNPGAGDGPGLQLTAARKAKKGGAK